MDGRGRDRTAISLPWAAAAAIMIALIWTNSMVPGDESTSASLSVVVAVQEVLGALGLPSAWVTNLLVRKMGHFLEYLALGAVVSQALDPGHALEPSTFAAAAIVLVLVPAVDEAIQLSIPGRSGQLSDVVLDVCGAACGVCIRSLIIRGARRRRG